MKIRTASILTFLLFLTSCSVSKSLVDVYEPINENTQRAYFTGQNHLIKGDLEAAYASFQVCVEAEPEVASFYFDLAKIDHELARHESALFHYNLAIDLDPNNDWFLYHRALTLLALENYDDAWVDFAFWITKRPSDLEALEMCGTMFILSGEVWHAYKLLSYYEDAMAHNVEVRNLRLSLLLDITTDLDKIEKFVDDAIEDFPEEELFHYEKALVKIMMGENDAAIAILEGLKNSHTCYSEVYLALAECYLKAGRDKEAAPLLEKAFKDDSINPQEKLNVLLRLSDSHQINNLVEMGTNAHPDDENLFFFSGIHFTSEGDMVRAATAFKKVIEINPEAFEARLNYLSVLVKTKSWDSVIIESDDALLVFPLEPAFYYYNGIAHKSNNDFNSAITSFKGGLSVIFDSPTVAGQIASELAFCLREVGGLEKSYEAFEESLGYVEDPFVMNNHAYFLATDGQRIQDALKWSTKANLAMPDEPNFLDTQAFVLHLLDRNEEALKLIQLAQSLLGGDSSPNAVFLEREGDILRALVRNESAQVKWEAAIMAGGGKTRLNEKLDKIAIP